MVESTVAATAGATDAEGVGVTTAEEVAPSLVTEAGAGAAEVLPVTVVTTGAVSVREIVCSSSAAAVSEAEASLDVTTLETSLLDDTINAVLLAWSVVVVESAVETGSVD